jgi:hypothetical protein
MIKTYIDIEIAYRGEKTGQQFFRDYKNFFFDVGGVIGILKIDVDTESKTYKEVSFDQIEFPNIWGLANGGLLDIGNDELLITWNGRQFDIPILINHIVMEKGNDVGMNKMKQILSRDRDLIDICLKRGIGIKGGLLPVCRRCGVELQDLDCFNEYCEIEPEKGKEAYQILYFSKINLEKDDRTIEDNRNDPEWKKEFDELTKTTEYREYAKIPRIKNEVDVRILPLFEDKLGLLYNARIDEDLYHHNW